MFLFKLGKEKLKYKLFMTLHKVKYEGSVNLQAGWVFKIEVISLEGAMNLFSQLNPSKREKSNARKI